MKFLELLSPYEKNVIFGFFIIAFIFILVIMFFPTPDVDQSEENIIETQITQLTERLDSIDTNMNELENYLVESIDQIYTDNKNIKNYLEVKLGNVIVHDNISSDTIESSTVAINSDEPVDHDGNDALLVGIIVIFVFIIGSIIILD